MSYLCTRYLSYPHLTYHHKQLVIPQKGLGYTVFSLHMHHQSSRTKPHRNYYYHGLPTINLPHSIIPHRQQNYSPNKSNNIIPQFKIPVDCQFSTWKSQILRRSISKKSMCFGVWWIQILVLSSSLMSFVSLSKQGTLEPQFPLLHAAFGVVRSQLTNKAPSRTWSTIQGMMRTNTYNDTCPSHNFTTLCSKHTISHTLQKPTKQTVVKLGGERVWDREF